jgi:hypothetical protein
LSCIDALFEYPDNIQWITNYNAPHFSHFFCYFFCLRFWYFPNIFI